MEVRIENPETSAWNSLEAEIFVLSGKMIITRVTKPVAKSHGLGGGEVRRRQPRICVQFASSREDYRLPNVFSKDGGRVEMTCENGNSFYSTKSH